MVVGQVLTLGHFGILSSLYLVVFLFYRIYLHPLARYPGPKLAAISDWYVGYFASKGQLHWKIHEWHQTYGSVLRIGPNSIIFNDYDRFKEIYGPNPNLVKSSRYAAVSASHTPNLVTDNDQARVNMKRKAHLDMWNNRSLKLAEPRLHGLISTFLDMIKPEKSSDSGADSWSETRNLSEVGTWYGYDVTVSMATGENPDLMRSSEKRYLPATSVLVSWRALTASFQPKLHLWNLDKILLAPLYSKVMGLGMFYWKLTKDRARKGIIGSQDLTEVMMKTDDAKRGLKFSTKELWLEIFLLGGVGSTTIGPFTSALIFFLLHSPQRLERLVSEVRGTVMSENDICVDGKLQSCEYLWACVDELFRLMPTITNPLFRTVQKDGVVINDTYFGEGTELGSSIFEIHRNENYFQDPHEFKPERYLGSEEQRKEAKKYWVPFSRGNRTCVGPALAYMVTGQTLASILWRFDARLAPEACCGSVPCDQLKSHHNYSSYVGLKTEGPLVQFRERGDVEIQ